MPLSARVRDALLDAAAVVLPVDCVACGAHDRALCAACASALVLEVSSRPLAPELRVWSGLEYDGVARAAMLAFKQNGRRHAARALAPALAAAVVAAAPSPAGIDVVAVPGSRAAYRRRGYDPVRALLARAGLPDLRVFAAARGHAAQKQLAVDQRERNLHGVFRLRSPVAGRRILLVDDVVTTGATLRQAARVLSDGGAQVVAAAVVASTPRRFASSVHPLRGSTVTDP
jgi:ComF family protein